jgi:phosphoglycolate phosphatase
MFGELRTRGIKTGILTRNCTEAVRTIFPDILAYSDAVVTRDDTEKVKPHPDHLLAVLSSLREDPERTAMVGDHPMDMILGKRVGAFAVGVLTGYSGADALRGAGADLILKEAAHIMGHLK